MGIGDYIRAKKKAIMDYKDKREQQKTIRTANQLKEIKKERIKAEGREKIFKAKDREEMKLKKAKMNLRKRTPAYRVQDALKDRVKQNRKEGKGLLNLGSGSSGMGGGFVNNLGGSSFNNNFMNRLDGGSSSSFLDRYDRKPTKKKSKGKSITITLK